MRHDAEAETGAVWATTRRPAHHAGRTFHAQVAARRAAAAVERPARRDELCRTAPRTARVREDLTEQIPFYGERHAVKPGLTGWAQVRYSYGASVEDALEKLQYDLFYIKNLSMSLDLFIIFETVKTVILRKGT